MGRKKATKKKTTRKERKKPEKNGYLLQYGKDWDEDPLEMCNSLEEVIERIEELKSGGDIEDSEDVEVYELGRKCKVTIGKIVIE